MSYKSEIVVSVMPEFDKITISSPRESITMQIRDARVLKSHLDYIIQRIDEAEAKKRAVTE